MSAALKQYHGLSSNLRALQIRKLKEVKGRIIIVGDVHGCVAELDAMVKETHYNQTVDALILVGDFVNKGYDSIGVVKRCIELGAYGVLGNHDFTLLHVADALDNGLYADQVKDLISGTAKKKDAVLELAVNMPPECMAYLRQLPHIIRIPQHNVIVLHAGINISVPLEQQDVFDVLHVRTLIEGRDGVMRGSYGNTGTLWAELYQGPEQIVFGHDARTGFRQYAHAIGLDSGCVYGNTLTAVVYNGATPAKGVITQVASKYNCKPQEVVRENVSPGDSPAPLHMNQHKIAEEVRRGFAVDAIGTPVSLAGKAGSSTFISTPTAARRSSAVVASAISKLSPNNNGVSAGTSPASLMVGSSSSNNNTSSSSTDNLKLIKSTIKAFISAGMLETLAVLSTIPEYSARWEEVIGSESEGLGKAEWESVLTTLFQTIHDLAKGIISVGSSPTSPSSSPSSPLTPEAKEEQLIASYLNLVTDILDVRGPEAAEDSCDLAHAACDAAKKKYPTHARLVKQVKLALP